MHIYKTKYKIQLWAIGWTLSQEARFYRGVIVGLLGSLLLSCVVIPLAFKIKSAMQAEANDLKVEIALQSGYSSACMDVMAIIAHEGDLDDIIAFARAKGESGFSPMVSPTNFYPEVIDIKPSGRSSVRFVMLTKGAKGCL